ncbi:hypothetical protein Tco_0255541, partial [Tanacetum coccineum]
MCTTTNQPSCGWLDRMEAGWPDLYGVVYGRIFMGSSDILVSPHGGVMEFFPKGWLNNLESAT